MCHVDEQRARLLKHWRLLRFSDLWDLRIHISMHAFNMSFVAISVEEQDWLFCEANLGQSKPGNTNHNHALLLKSLVPLFAIIWSSIQKHQKTY